MREAGLLLQPLNTLTHFGQAYSPDIAASTTLPLPEALWYPQGQVSKGLAPGIGFLQGFHMGDEC